MLYQQLISTVANKDQLSFQSINQPLKETNVDALLSASA